MFILILKIIRNIGFTAKSKKIKARDDSNSIVNNSEMTNQISSIKGINQAKTTKFKILIKSKNHDFLLNSKNMKAKSNFFILKAKLAFRQIFVKILIFYYFSSKYYI